MMLPENEGKELSYAFTPLEVIPEPQSDTAARITHVDLTETGIKSLDNLGRFSTIETLIVDKNALQDIKSCPILPTLETLWCNNNNITDLSTFMDDVNQRFPNLKYLSMMRNPACPALMNIINPDVEANKLFRLYVLYRMPQLQIIDCEAVTGEVA